MARTGSVHSESPMGRVSAAASVTVSEENAPSAAQPVVALTERKVGRVPGLDTLRFFLAAWVVFGHAGFFPVAGLSFNHPYAVAERLSFSGTMSVMVFFLISGFCIHLPYAHGRRIEPVPFYLRREIRILPPVAGMYVVGFLVKDFAFKGVLWSLVCEEIYYCVYPGLFKILRSTGFRNVLVGSAVVATVLLVTRMGRAVPDVRYEHFALTWIECLPVWLLGALLAENLMTIRERQVPAWRVWAWRGLIWFLSVVSLASGHKGVPLAFTVIPIGALSYFWLRDEIAYFHRKPPPEWLEKLGLASYTLYIGHMIVASKLGLSTPGPVTTLQWMFGMALIAAFVWAFYYFVERPSHTLARAIGKRFERPQRP